MAHLDLSLLGGFLAELDGHVIDGFSSDKARALLAYLAVEADHPHRREALAALLWPERAESQARASLSQAIYNLRSVLGDRGRAETAPSGSALPFLSVSGQAIRFNASSDYHMDVASFCSLLQACAEHAHRAGEECDACMRRLDEAVSLYRGGFLQDLAIGDSVPYEEWVVTRREQLHRRALEALQRLAAAHERRGETERGLVHAWRQVELDPWREEGQRQLMRLLALSGQRSAALAQYETCRRVLQAELQAEPEPETVALYEAIRQGTFPALPSPSLPLSPSPFRPLSARPLDRAVEPLPTNLPAQSSPFIGREGLLGDILERLRDPACRLLTLVGPGGCGKTRLALEAGERLVENRPCRDDVQGGQPRGAAPTEANHPVASPYPPADGVFLVSLAPLRTPETIAPTIAAAVGCNLSGGDPRPPERQLLDYFHHKAMLLILDNCEHLLAGMGLVTALLEAAPSTKVLATTRERLNLQGEHLLPVGGMDLPEGDAGGDDVGEYSAVQLFVQGARQVRPGWAPSPEELGQVVGICRRVQGMPLAILLAAGWMEMLPPGEIDAEIARSLDFLSGGARDLPERQRSVRATFEHSWRLLTAEEQGAMAALSVCRGSYDHEAACAVSGAALPTLRALVDKSLLQSVAGERLEMHELLRQFAGEMLARSPEAGRGARERHAAHYMGLLARLDPRSRAGGWGTVVAALRPDIENARAAWEWSVAQGHVARLEEAIRTLASFFHNEGRTQEGIEVCDLALAARAPQSWAPGTTGWPYLRGQALAWKGSLQHWRAEYELERDTLRQGLEALQEAEAQGRDTRFEHALAMYMLSDNYQVRWDMTKGLELAEQALALFCEAGNSRWVAQAQTQMGYIAFLMGQGCAEARRALERSVAICRQQDDHRSSARVLLNLALAVAYGGDLRRAEPLAREGLATAQEGGEPGMVALTTSFLGMVLLLGGGTAQAESLLERVVAAPRGVNDQLLGLGYYVLGTAKMHQGAYAEAHAPLERAVELFCRCGSATVALATYMMGSVALAEANLAEAAARYGEALPSLRRSGVICWLGFCGPLLVELELGHEEQAKALLVEDLRSSAAKDYALWRAGALAGAAVWLARHGQAQRAVEVYALASQHPQIAASRWWEDVAGRHVAAAARTLPPEVAAVAQARGRARDVQATLDELLAELVR